MTHAELEDRLHTDGMRLLRQLFQDSLDLRAGREERLGGVTDTDGGLRGWWAEPGRQLLHDSRDERLGNGLATSAASACWYGPSFSCDDNVNGEQNVGRGGWSAPDHMTVSDIDANCRMWTLDGPGRQHELAPGSPPVW
jgi:hypothetical protein